MVKQEKVGMKRQDDGKRRWRKKQNRVVEQRGDKIETDESTRRERERERRDGRATCDSSCFSGRADVSMKRRKPNQRTRKGKRGSAGGRDAALKQGREGESQEERE